MTPRQFSEIKAMVEAAITARRALWSIVCRRDRVAAEFWLELESDEVNEWVRQLSPLLKEEIAADDGRVSVQCLETHALLRPLLARFQEGTGRGLFGDQIRADVASLVWRRVKETHKIACGRGVFYAFRSMCETLDRLRVVEPFAAHAQPLDLRDQRCRNVDCSSPAVQRALHSDLLALLRSETVASDDDAQDRANQYVDLFFDVCFSLEDLDLGGITTGTGIRPEWLDSQFLLSRLYGTRTGIPGFDVLFEGGINLAERMANPFSPARTILVRGQFNAGKSILSLSLAVEVARKGGVSTVVSLEGSSDVLKGYLSSFNLADEPQYNNAQEGGPELAVYRIGGGELRLLSYPAARFNLDQLLAHIENHVAQEAGRDHDPESEKLSRPQGSRLLIIDSVNSVLDVPSVPNVPEIREKMMGMIENVHKNVGNIVLVAETPEPSFAQRMNVQSWTEVLPYIADVVMDLSNDRQHGYDQRYIQVCKSRFQRERRGRHPIAIVPGRGLVIAPASVALRSEFRRPRWGSDSHLPIHFGLAAIDRLIPQGALLRADAIVLRGPQRSFKTLLGLHFLSADGAAATPGGFRRKALILADRHDLRLDAFAEACTSLPRDYHQRVTFLPLLQGFVQPGRVLCDIQQCFEDARALGYVYDRVLIPNIGRWDLDCPFIREDPGFADALLDLLQWEGASTVFLCSEKHVEPASHLQRTVVDRAKALLDFQHLEFGGSQRVLMRCVRTRAVPLSEDWHEITLQGGNLQIDPSLLRVPEHGEGSPPKAIPVKITLNLFQVGPVQTKYHDEIKARLQSVLTTGVVVNGINRAVLQEASRLGALSVGSDLQLVQIDEFQLPALKRSSYGRSLLQPFPLKAGQRWEGDVGLMNAIRAEGLADRHQAAIIALPYYRNIAFLAISPKHPEILAAADDWHKLVDLSRTWSGKKPFFNFAKKSEDYNCVFLEIALSLSPNDFLRGDVACGQNRDELMDWLTGQAFKEALSLFHPLCATAHNMKPDKRWEQGPPPWSGAVTRVWFTALRFWLENKGREDGGKPVDDTTEQERNRIEIVALPGGVALSGDWYLGVWAHSAVPQIGLKIMESLASPEAQLERLGLGIGLPTESGLLADNIDQLFPSYASTRKLDIPKLVSNARCRSRFFNYNLLQQILSHHLISFLSQSLDGDLVARTQRGLVRDVAAVIKDGTPAPQPIS